MSEHIITASTNTIDNPFRVERGSGFASITEVDYRDCYVESPRFNNHESLESIYCGRLLNKDLSGFFANCSNLSKCDMIYVDLSHIVNVDDIFLNCTSLSDLTLSNLPVDKNVLFDLSHCNLSEQTMEGLKQIADGECKIRFSKATRSLPNYEACVEVLKQKGYQVQGEPSVFDFTVNGLGTGVDVITLFVDELESPTLSLQVQSDSDEFIWSVSNKLLEGRYKDLRYYGSRSSVDGVQKVAYGSWNASSKEFTNTTVNATSLKVSDNITLETQKASSTTEIYAYKELRIDESNGKKAYLDIASDGRFTISVTDGYSILTKQVNIVSRDLVAVTTNSNKANTSDDVNNYEANGAGLELKNCAGKFTFNPVIKTLEVGDVIEVHNRMNTNASGSEEENSGLKFNMLMLSSTHKNAGIPSLGLTWADWSEDERCGYNTSSQWMPLKQEVDYGWNSVYAWTKYTIVENSKGYPEVILSMTNKVDAFGRPDYQDSVTIVANTYVTYKDGSDEEDTRQYKITDTSTNIDAWTFVYSSCNNGSNCYIDGKQVNTNTSAEVMVDYAKSNITILYNGECVFGDR